MLNIFIDYYSNKEELAQLKMFFDFEDLSNESQIFFKKNACDETVFEKILEFGIDKYDLNDENYVIKCVSIDPIEIINIVLKVHLNIDKKITNLEQINIKTINREVKKSNISADLKSSFYSFLIDPICAIELLCKDVKFIYNQVSSLYNLKFTKNTLVLKKEVQEFVYNYREEIRDTVIYYSYSLVFKDKMFYYNFGSIVVIIMGCNYRKSNSCDKIDLTVIGNVLSDKNRLKILDILMQNDICNINDINNIMNINNTTLFYHLSLMLKSRIIRRENKGKTVYYSVDKQFVKSILMYLKRYE